MGMYMFDLEIDKGHNLYPQSLLNLREQAPQTIWVRGENLDLLENIDKTLIVAGSRASTGYGEHVTMEIVSELSERGVPIISDGAYGIAGMASRSALASNKPTMVWLAGGIDRLYPSGHDALLKRVMDTGLIITAKAPGTAPTRELVEERAKYMAYATAGTLLVEAGERSTSLNYARMSRYAGKFALGVPGPVTSASSVGIHELLRHGDLKIATNAEQVYETMMIHRERQLRKEEFLANAN